MILGMDSGVRPCHGELRELQRLEHGHFGCTCYHPLFVFNQFGDLERCAAQMSGNGYVRSADGWEQMLKPVIALHRTAVKRIAFEFQALPLSLQPNMYELLEGEGIRRIDLPYPQSRYCKSASADLLKRPVVGRLGQHYAPRFYRASRYRSGELAYIRAESSRKLKVAPRRIVPSSVGFIVTNLRCRSEERRGVLQQAWNG